MDWKRFDSLRSNAGPIELDLVEAYAQNRIGRRDFVKRGTIIGLSAPFMGAIIAACGSSSDGEAAAEPTAAAESSGSTDAEPTSAPAAAETTSGGNLIVGNQFGDANSGLDPVAMLDLGTYNIISQSFEYLVGLGADGNISDNALATGWSPNGDGSQWTFDLRDDAVWRDGSPLTSADVAATMDRMVEFGNSGLAGVIEAGSVDSSDPSKAVITLVEPNGNFPVLVSIFNPQSCITRADYSSGTTLNERDEGTGAWMLESFDPSTFDAKFVPNPNWWGGSTILDSLELRGFADIGTAVTAMSSRSIDVIQNFSVIGGEGLLNDAAFSVLTPPSSNHRQVWFNVQEGDFATSNLVRQALGWCLDREQMVSTLFSGRAEIGNDHPILSSLPFFDADATPQRTRDIDMAKSLMAEAGVDEVNATFTCGDLGEVPDLANIIRANAAEAGINLTVDVQANSTFYGNSWCPGPSETDPTQPCAGSGSVGAVDYGHRPIPDIFLSSALSTGGVWNSSNYASDTFDGLLSDYRTAPDVASQKTAIGAIQKLMHEDQPALYPYFFNFLAGHDENVSGIQATALGHIVTSKASKA